MVDIDELREEMNRGAVDRLGERFALVGPGGEPAPEAELVCVVVPEFVQQRLVTRHSEPPEGSRMTCVFARRDTEGVCSLAVRAILESRAVGLLVATEGERSGGAQVGRLAELPFPELTPAFSAQLELLYRRRGRVDAETPIDRSVDLSVERIVAELYELSLKRLVDLQEAFRRSA